MIDALKNNVYSEINHKLTYGDASLRQFLEDNKDTIIERSVEQITNAIKSSKKYREALAKVAEEVIG